MAQGNAYQDWYQLLDRYDQEFEDVELDPEKFKEFLQAVNRFETIPNVTTHEDLEKLSFIM